MKIGERIEERAEFSEEERKRILARTKYRCASCGEKLDIVRHTVEHVIPLSRGGKNEEDNLIALCYRCNKAKGNLFYFPGDYYIWAEVEMPSLITKLHEYAEDWVKQYIKNFDLKKYPLLSPISTIVASPKQMNTKRYIPQFLYDIVRMNHEMRSVFSRYVNWLDGYAYYAIIKRTTQDLMMIIRIEYKDDYQYESVPIDLTQITTFVEYTKLTKSLTAKFAKSIAAVISTRMLRNGVPVDEIVICSTDPKIARLVLDEYGIGLCTEDEDTQLYRATGEGYLHGRPELGSITYAAYILTKKGQNAVDRYNYVLSRTSDDEREALRESLKEG